MKIIILITTIISLLSNFDSLAMTADCRNSMVRIEASEDIILKRSFARVEAAAITITEADLKNAYQFGKLEITNVYVSSARNVDVGAKDLVNAQIWSVTGIGFVQADTALVVDPTTTPQTSAFPNANIALRKYKNHASCATCDDYEYYAFRNTGIYLEGESYLDPSSDNNEYEIDSLTFLLTDLPADIKTDFIVNDTLDMDDTTVYMSGYIRTEGFGSIRGADGSSHEVIKTVNLLKEIKNGKTTTTKYINFFSNSGYSLTLFLSDTSVTNGIAKVRRMEERYITSVPTSIEKNLGKKTDIKFYPNPVMDRLYIENAINSAISIEDLTGRTLLDKKFYSEEKVEIDVAHLLSGVYFLSVNNNRIKFIKE